MNLLKKLFVLPSKKQTDRALTKDDIKIKHRSWLYFQLGLIVAILAMFYVVNIEVEERALAYVPPQIDSDEYLRVFILPEPKPEAPQPKKKAPKKALPTEPTPEPDSTPEPDTPDPEPATDPGPDTTPPDKPTTQATAPKVPATPYNIKTVYQVPIFPGCEGLDTNEERLECMSKGLAKIVRRRFDSGVIGEVGLAQKQIIHLGFVIDQNGEVSHLQIRAPHPRLEKEVQKVVRHFPGMQPGRQPDGQPVKVMYNLPIVVQPE